jgi:hypothetical protein
MSRRINAFASALGLLLSLSCTAQTAPGSSEMDVKKVLTLVSNDLPGLRCNNNIQVAAELPNTYKVPILI